jgi:hypothetical protein
MVSEEEDQREVIACERKQKGQKGAKEAKIFVSFAFLFPTTHQPVEKLIFGTDNPCLIRRIRENPWLHSVLFSRL